MGRKGTARDVPSTIKLEEGTATFMGDGCWILNFVDPERRGEARFNRVALSDQDMQAMLKYPAAA